MPEVQSSAIRSIDYDAEARELDIAFRSGATYRYVDVPQQVFEDFLAAPSKGAFFQHEVNERYAFRRIA